MLAEEGNAQVSKPICIKTFWFRFRGCLEKNLLSIASRIEEG